MGCIQNVCKKDKEQGLRQLHLAAESGDTEAVKRLLMLSANVDVLDKKHSTPLHIATLNGHVDVVNLLLSKNATVDSRNAFGQTSLHLASEKGHLAIAEILLNSNADVHVTDLFMNTPIHIAAMHDHYELIQLLMKHSVLLICYGNRPLHLAAKCGHFEVAQLLLNYGENPDATNLDGNTPLHLASENYHFEVVEVLLRNKADSYIRNAFGKTPLHIAAETGYMEIVKALIYHHGEVDAVDRNGDTALHFAARNGHSAVVNVLLNQTTEMDAQIRSQLAVNQVPPAELELSQHPFINTVDVDHTSNHIVAEGCNVTDEFEFSQHPIKYKVDDGHTSTPIVAESGNVEIADTILCHSSTVNAVFKGQATPIGLAVEQGHAEIVKNLTFNGANVNACNNAKMTALHLACQNGHTSIVEILLDNHAVVDIMRQSQETPFHLATRNGHADVLGLLLRRGICDFVLTNRNQTPLHVAVKEGHTKVVEVILKHSRKISGKFTNDGQELQKNSKNLIETRDIKPIQLLKSDGRCVSAGVVLAEKTEPLEIWKDSDGHIALELAVISARQKMVQLLLDVDHCVYSEEHLSRNCFHYLILAILHCMIKHRNNIETAKVRSNDEYKMNCRSIKEIAKALINSSKFNVNHQGRVMDTPLHRVMNLVDWHSKLKLANYMIQLLLEKGADFNMKNSDGNTPLMIASEEGCCDVIQILFDWERKSGIKLDIEAGDHYGATALIKAAERHHVSAVQLLLSHKASVDLYDYYGFTALHAAIYEPNLNWFDLHFFCDELLERNFDSDDYLEISSMDKPTWEEEIVDPCKILDVLENYCNYNEVKIRSKEEVVKLLLDNEETDVNVMDFRGNTPLDLAVKSSERINSATLKALEDHGAIRGLLEPKYEAPIEVARVDERGQNPLHRLIISRISNYAEGKNAAKRKENHSIVKCMVYGILLRPDDFRETATATDDKGRTSLHYAVMIQSFSWDQEPDLVKVLLELGSNVNAADNYGKTPLHYAEMNDRYELLVAGGANEDTNDNFGDTPRHLRQLRESVTMSEDSARNLSIGKKALYTSIDIAQILNTNHVTELSKRKLVETIHIYSQSDRPQESSEEAIWKVWTPNDFIRLNRRLSQLKPLIRQFIERLADGIKEKDGRFECQPTLVGSADEETKAVISADFDFNFNLIKFSQLCDPFPHPLGPKGYFQLRRKPNDDTKSRSDEKFDSFFNLDHYLLTNEVNSRFKIILEDVLSDPAFWQDEHLFDWNEINIYKTKSEKLDGLFKTVRFRMIHPIEDGDGGFLFVNISIDIVACIHVKDWWPDDPLPVGISPAVKLNGCTLVFDQPRFDPSKPFGAHFLFSETFARISFAPLESRIIKESSPLIKMAYIVCKMLFYFHPGTKPTYQLKTCLLFCMEALNAHETKKEEITPKQLAFWVERIMFCFVEFSRHYVYPCYFMPSFRQRVVQLIDGHEYLDKRMKDKVNVSSEALNPFSHSVAYDFYLDLCPDDCTIDIPIVQRDSILMKRRIDPNSDQVWEQFDREEFIRMLSSRSSH